MGRLLATCQVLKGCSLLGTRCAAQRIMADSVLVDEQMSDQYGPWLHGPRENADAVLSLDTILNYTHAHVILVHQGIILPSRPRWAPLTANALAPASSIPAKLSQTPFNQYKSLVVTHLDESENQ